MSRALEDDTAAAEFLEGALDVGQRVRLVRIGLDPDALQGVVRVQHPEEAERPHEVVDYFEPRGVVFAVA